jgi:oxygen-independent coproporphyrinogen-3 oxidase
MAIDALRRAKRSGFESLNVDLMFALPDQTIADWESDLRTILGEGVDQLSTYPMFAFPYTELGQDRRIKEVRRPPSRTIRAMLELTERLARDNGLARCAVWSWLRPSRKKFSSITRHHYVGFGPSAASMTGTHFSVNSFDVGAYASALPAGRPIALSMEIDRRLEMAYWLYWRVYELEIRGDDFSFLFGEGESLTSVFGRLFRSLQLLSMLVRDNGTYRVTQAGAYWIHRLQNEYSLNYINRLWGACRRNPWPAQVVL